MDRRVLHKQYKKRDIRSIPIKGLHVRGPLKWKVQLNIIFPKGAAMETIRVYLIENPRYLTRDEAHTAGLEYGHRIIDQWIRTGRIPPTLTDDLPRPQRAEIVAFEN